jgi:hypothetical protein
MKRLLLSQGRTGSLNLTRYIRESNLNTIVYREPFNTTAIKDTGIIHQFEKIISNPDIFVENKIGNDSFPIELQNLNTDQLVTLLKSKFDVIGILMRKDINSQTESLANARKSDNWNSKYVYQKIDSNTTDKYKNLLENEKNTFTYISEKYNIPIFYYEDLYIENQNENVMLFCKHFNIKYDKIIMEKHMNIDKKYRINESKTIL